MNVAKYLLLALLALPFLELVAFIAVAEIIGFLWALTLLIATSMAGGLVLRHAGGNHIARVRVAMGQGGFTALQADSSRDHDPACRNSPAYSRVYNGCSGAFAVVGAIATGLRRTVWDKARTNAARRRGRSPNPSNGTRCPIPLFRTGATTHATVDSCSPQVAVLANRRD